MMEQIAPEEIVVEMNGTKFLPCGIGQCPAIFASDELRAAHQQEWHAPQRRNRDPSPYYDESLNQRPRNRTTIPAFRTHPYRHSGKGRKR